MTLKIRKPSGKPPWPMILLAGSEKSGKSWSAAEFSSSDLIGRTFWIEIGEGSADQYGAMPGARYEIIDHDGSYQQILTACREAAEEPAVKGKPNAIVIDSMTELWELLCNEQQQAANVRRNAAPGTDATINMDQWNAAKRRWRRVIDALRVHDGPVILTARFEKVTVVGPDGKPAVVIENGRPTKTPVPKEWKVRAEKNLPFEVDGIVELPKPRQAYLNGMRSVVLQVPAGGHMPLPDFTIDKLFRDLGLSAATTGARTYVAPKIDENAAPVVLVTEQERSGVNRLADDLADEPYDAEADAAAMWTEESA